uniref:Uncharacterized protein n=1 Tax=viral metagenome TaxID=1070528 RepID=A0A6M3XWG9_9ZZZZ
MDRGEQVYCYLRLPRGDRYAGTVQTVSSAHRWLEQHNLNHTYDHWFADDNYVVLVMNDRAVALQLKLSLA